MTASYTIWYDAKTDEIQKSLQCSWRRSVSLLVVDHGGHVRTHLVLLLGHRPEHEEHLDLQAQGGLCQKKTVFFLNIYMMLWLILTAFTCKFWLTKYTENYFSYQDTTVLYFQPRRNGHLGCLYRQHGLQHGPQREFEALGTRCRILILYTITARFQQSWPSWPTSPSATCKHA